MGRAAAPRFDAAGARRGRAGHALAETLGASITVEDADGRLLACAPEHGYHPPPDATARHRRPVQAALDVEGRLSGDLIGDCCGPGAPDPDGRRGARLHPNAVSYRLARIEQLTGRSLRRPDTRLELQRADRARRRPA